MKMNVMNVRLAVNWIWFNIQLKKCKKDIYKTIIFTIIYQRGVKNCKIMEMIKKTK